MASPLNSSAHHCSRATMSPGERRLGTFGAPAGAATVDNVSGGPSCRPWHDTSSRAAPGTTVARSAFSPRVDAATVDWTATSHRGTTAAMSQRRRWCQPYSSWNRPIRWRLQCNSDSDTKHHVVHAQTQCDTDRESDRNANGHSAGGRLRRSRLLGIAHPSESFPVTKHILVCRAGRRRRGLPRGTYVGALLAAPACVQCPYGSCRFQRFGKPV